MAVKLLSNKQKGMIKKDFDILKPRITLIEQRNKVEVIERFLNWSTFLVLLAPLHIFCVCVSVLEYCWPSLVAITEYHRNMDCVGLGAEVAFALISICHKQVQ